MEKRKLIPGMQTPNAVFIDAKTILIKKGEFKKRYRSIENIEDEKIKLKGFKIGFY